MNEMDQLQILLARFKPGQRVYATDMAPHADGWYLLHRANTASGAIDSPDASVTLCPLDNAPGQYINTLASNLHESAPAEDVGGNLVIVRGDGGVDVRIRAPFLGYCAVARKAADGAAGEALDQRCWVYFSNACGDEEYDSLMAFSEATRCSGYESTLNIEFNVLDLVSYLKESYELARHGGLISTDGKRDFDTLRADLVAAIAEIDALKFE